MVQARSCQSRQQEKNYSINNAAEYETELYISMSHANKDRAQLVACSVTYLKTQGDESNSSTENVSYSGQARHTSSLAVLQNPKALLQDSN